MLLRHHRALPFTRTSVPAFCAAPTVTHRHSTARHGVFAVLRHPKGLRPCLHESDIIVVSSVNKTYTLYSEQKPFAYFLKIASPKLYSLTGYQPGEARAERSILITGALGQLGMEIAANLRSKFGRGSVLVTDIRKASDEVYDAGPYRWKDMVDGQC